LPDSSSYSRCLTIIHPVLFKNSIPFTVLVRWSDSL
jgi:hypothetical protein